MIVAERLSKTYSGHKAIDGVSFQIKDGEIVGLLGLNGAGKSTILKILGCFLLPSGGRATIDGHSVDENPQAIRRLIGYLPDTPPLYDEMTVESYLRYVARLKDVPSVEVDGRVKRVMGDTSTDKVAGVQLGELSHGYRQRVGIAQAMVHGPRVLILDEPINGLDPVQIKEMRDLILSLRGKHTVILSSHILSEITKTCDRILIVDQGRLVAEGSEVDLQSGMTKSLKLALELDRVPAGLEAALKGIAGVASVTREPVVASAVAGAKVERLTVATSGDVRAAVAKAVVDSGAGLLGLSRAEAGLEGIFMKMIKGNAGEVN
jgi:ABC-2 type transport system ATP-binding protein